MYRLIVNGIEREVEKDQKLMDYLRDELKLKSVKDGCSEGACGTCTIIVDGKTMKSCVLPVSKFDGKTILTVEGLSDEEKAIYVHAFGEAGAVQCGFCIPGMVMCGKALLDVNPNPTRDEIAFALRNNICRCTGYKKIIDAIEMVAEILRNDGKIPGKEEEWLVGNRVHRVDVAEKVLGYGEYVDDVEMEGVIYGSAIRTAYPRAIVKAIHTEKAKALPGVLAVLTAEDIPGQNKVGHLKLDWDTMIPVGGTTRYLGDAVCLVAAETEEILEAAKKLVQVEYEPLEGVFSPQDALKEGAPLVHETGNLLAHERLVRGDAEEALKNSKYVVTETFHTPFTEHAFLEPECAIAFPYKDGIKIYTSDQGTYDTRKEVSIMLGYDPERVYVENKLVGGGFGGKEDVSVQHHAALLTHHLNCPVKVKLTRQESITIHPKRHPMDMEFTLGCDENGKLTALKAKIVSDTGAYASLGGPVLQRACTHAAGPYNYQTIDIEGKAVYTNNPPAGAYRGFGVTQSCFATESLINLLAEKVGISPWEIRYRNAIRPGEVLPNGQIADESTGLAETLEAVKDFYESEPYAGIACAMKNAGVGVGLPDWGRVILAVVDGKVHIRSGASCIGQGLGTILVQLAYTTLKIDRDLIIYDAANSETGPDSGTTSGSRQTLITGEACRRAAEKLAEALKTQSLAELNGKEFYGEYLGKTDKMGADVPNPVSHVAYGYATQVVALNEDGTVKKVVAAHDVGKALNPISVEGQIEGGVVMSLGYALTEDFPLKEGKPMVKFGTLGLFKANKTPDVESIIVEKPGVPYAEGAIGVGEIVSIPTAPAVQGAFYKKDGEFRTSLPLVNTPYFKKRK